MNDALRVLTERGFVSQVTDQKAVEDLLGKGQVTFYVGFDPTADSLHAGSLLPLMAMAHMQRNGHRPIAILGGGTAMVGDPSGKTEMRKMLSAEQINRNAEGLRKQLSRFIDLDSGEALMLNNSDWLMGLNYIEFLRDIGRHFSVNRMLSFESYKIRMEKGLSFLEFNYQLLQAYDFLVLYREHSCKLQMGGDDQWGNIVAGMDLIRRVESGEAHGLTFPLLTTASGEKMGKTAKGAVWLSAERTSPYDFFQYFRNTDDRDVKRFLAYFTFLPMEEVRKLGALKDAEINEAKEVLAYEATRIVHGEQAAQEARQGAKSAFGGMDSGRENIPTTSISKARLVEGILAIDLFAQVFSQSKSDARRLIKGGGARIGENKVSGFEHMVTMDALKDGQVLLRAGKKRIHRIVVKD